VRQTFWSLHRSLRESVKQEHFGGSKLSTEIKWPEGKGPKDYIITQQDFDDLYKQVESGDALTEALFKRIKNSEEENTSLRERVRELEGNLPDVWSARAEKAEKENLVLQQKVNLLERRISSESIFCGTVWMVHFSNSVVDITDGPYATRADAEKAFPPRPAFRYEEVGVIGQRKNTTEGEDRDSNATRLNNTLIKEQEYADKLSEANKRLRKELQDLEYDKTRCDECIYHPNSEYRNYTDVPYKMPKILQDAEKLIAKLVTKSGNFVSWKSDIQKIVNSIIQHLKTHEEIWYSEQLRLDGWEEADQKRLKRLEKLEEKVEKLEKRNRNV